jgi:hypothetical protein
VELGLFQRTCSPAVIDKILAANAEAKSGGKARKQLRKLAEIEVSEPLIEDYTHEIGGELRAHLAQQATLHADGKLLPQHAEPPGVAVVCVDGGRIMTRAEGRRGVHEQAWKETKNACLQTMTSATFREDPHPQLPACFQQPAYVEKLVREIHAATTNEAAKNANNSAENELRERDKPIVIDASSDALASASEQRWQPRRLVRSCLSSLCTSDEFGPLVAGEAQRRGFYQARQRAFLGDGQAWNWTLQARHFCDFVAITDFVHPLGYLYEAARALAPTDAWSVCVRAAEAVWQGRVGEVIAALRAWETQHPIGSDETLAPHDPRAVVARTVTYLVNNEPRMKYPAYRQAGLPVSSSMVESLIKEINFRVKGTEKFWNRPSGADAILQVRAASLDDDDRLSRYILSRPGSPHYRRSPPLATPA